MATPKLHNYVVLYYIFAYNHFKTTIITAPNKETAEVMFWASHSERENKLKSIQQIKEEDITR